jgi:hypothetical protein
MTARLPGFEYQRVDVDGVAINSATAGSGSPVCSKRSMARDQVGLMRELGFARFQLVVGRGYQPLSVWQEYAIDVRGEALPTGHFLPGEDPDLVTAALRGFLR